MRTTNSVLTCLILSLLMLLPCCSKEKKGLKIAATPVPHAEILEFIKPELASQGIDLEVIVTDDYNMPNRALAEKEVDANFFQHLPFLEEQIKQFDYPIHSVATVEIEPMGVYSRKVRSLDELRDYSVIAIPNDPTNEARALLLLQNQGLIKLQQTSSIQATVLNIAKNPKHFKFLEVDAAMLPRTLDDVEAAVINTNYALQANLSPLKDAIVLEGKNSPYANVLVIRNGDEERPDIQALEAAMNSKKMRDFILKQYKEAILPAF